MNNKLVYDYKPFGKAIEIDPNITPINYYTQHVCELCNIEKYRYDMYLCCTSCHKVFACFACGSQEINKRNNGIKSINIYYCNEHTKGCLSASLRGLSI